MSIDTIAWHDRTLHNHRAETAKAAAVGYRGVSLSLYGTPQDRKTRAMPPSWCGVHWSTPRSSGIH